LSIATWITCERTAPQARVDAPSTERLKQQSMSLRTSATRYAKALLAVAINESDPALIEKDLAGIVQAFNQHAELRRALISPRTPHAARVNVVRSLAQQAGVQSPVAKLLVMLAERNRLELLPAMLDVYSERLRAHTNVVRATVTSATPMTSDKVDRLAASLGSLTGKHVQIESTVDPSIIGGVVTRIGSTVYDGSIRTQLQKMRQQLVENA
jgi:F-type H+-transporting ATPase subunit delta